MELILLSSLAALDCFTEFWRVCFRFFEARASVCSREWRVENSLFVLVLVVVHRGRFLGDMVGSNTMQNKD